MLKQICHITHGYLIWLKYRMRFRIDDHKAVIVLTGENCRIDYYALIHLKEYVQRKFIEKVVILIRDKKVMKLIDTIPFLFDVKVHFINDRELSLFYDYYCFEEHMDNMVFTYVSKPADNLMQKILEETDIDEEEAVCLGLYCLRAVPKSDTKEILQSSCIKEKENL